MKKFLASILVLFLFIIILPKSKAYTNSPLDYIEEFNIIVSSNDDATLNFDYELKWKVLDSTSEGPLEWVKIGIPNKHIDKIVKISDSIKTAYYYNDKGSTCIRLDLDKKYYAGEVVDLHFSFHQTHMFTIQKEKDVEYVTYEYIPGWFDDINIGNLTVKWDKTNVYFDDSKDVDDNYLIWSASLNQGAQTSMKVSYLKDAFPNIKESESYEGPTDNNEWKTAAFVFLIIFLIIVFFSVLDRIFRRPSYYRTRGFYPYGRRFFYRNYYYGVNEKGTRKVNPYVSSGGSGHSGGHSCACACACACAGGGRAGCSKKDFYKGKIKIDDLIDKID
ncbi:MAG: hypothetical protein K6E24_02045 [bacterium]|nr:hypothetical protein [bacterium]